MLQLREMSVLMVEPVLRHKLLQHLGARRLALAHCVWSMLPLCGASN